MKKIISVLLIIAMLFAFGMLTACSEEKAEKDDSKPADNVAGNEQSEDKEEDNSAETNDKYPDVKVMIDAGESPLVGYCANNVNDSFLVGIIESIGEMMEADGFTYEYVSAESNVATQIEQMENYLTMGAVCMFVSPMEPNSIKDNALAAMDAGCYVIYFGSTPKDYEVSGLVNVSQPMIGEAAANMILGWIDVAYPDAGEGDIHSSLYTYSTTDEMLSRTDRIEEIFAEDGRIQITFRKDLLEGTVTEGFNAAQEALTADGDIRLLTCFSSSVALGASNYIMSQTELNKDEFGVFGTEDNEDARAAIDGSLKGESVFRGLAGAGGENGPDYSMWECAHALLFKEKTAPYYIWDPCYVYNVFGYEMPAE